MPDHVLGVGEALVFAGRSRLSVLEVRDGYVVLEVTNLDLSTTKAHWSPGETEDRRMMARPIPILSEN
jgi:hypothetical protein